MKTSENIPSWVLIEMTELIRTGECTIQCGGVHEYEVLDDISDILYIGKIKTNEHINGLYTCDDLDEIEVLKTQI